MFLIDFHHRLQTEHLFGITELGIPIVGIADTNCDPSGIDQRIPGNDDSPKAVQLYASVIATAVIEGRCQGKAINEGKSEEKSEPAAPKGDAKKAKVSN